MFSYPAIFLFRKIEDRGNRLRGDICLNVEETEDFSRRPVFEGVNVRFCGSSRFLEGIRLQLATLRTQASLLCTVYGFQELFCGDLVNFAFRCDAFPSLPKVFFSIGRCVSDRGQPICEVCPIGRIEIG